MTPALILASTSTYRRQLLERLGLPFESVAPGVDETPQQEEAPEILAQRLAQAKALAVSRLHGEALVIGSDQTAAVEGVLLGKPGTRDRAIAQLRACGGRTVRFYTAVALCLGGRLVEESCIDTRVSFRDLGTREIESYVDRDQPLDCAGSFRWEGLGITLFKGLESSDPTALEGLPLISVANMLRNQGINPLIT